MNWQNRSFVPGGLALALSIDFILKAIVLIHGHVGGCSRVHIGLLSGVHGTLGFPVSKLAALAAM